MAREFNYPKGVGARERRHPVSPDGVARVWTSAYCPLGVRASYDVAEGFVEYLAYDVPAGYGGRRNWGGSVIRADSSQLSN